MGLVGYAIYVKISSSTKVEIEWVLLGSKIHLPNLIYKSRN